MAEPVKVEQRYGVVDGSAGHAWVVVPRDRAAAHALNAQHRRLFWCSTLVGACGAQLSLRVGDEKIPHFSHYPGQAKSCPFAYDLEHAGIVELYDTPSGIRRWRRPLSTASRRDQMPRM